MFAKVVAWLNDLNPKQLVILAGIVMFLMFTSIYFFLSWWIAKNEEEKEVIPAEPEKIVAMQSVVVAKSDIPPQTILKNEMLEMKEVPEELVSHDAVTEISNVVNKSAKTAIFAGDVITKKKLMSDLNQNTFVGSIPPDCRAVSISVNEVTGVDGFAKPGDKVDLVLVENDENKSVTTTVFLQNVLLLSINKDMSKSQVAKTDEEGNVTSTAIEDPSTATLALRSDEVLKVIAASKLGEIYLMLRPLRPTENYSADMVYTLNSVNANKKNQNEVSPVTPPQATIPQTLPPIPDKSNTVEVFKNENTFEIIQGDKVTQ